MRVNMKRRGSTIIIGVVMALAILVFGAWWVFLTMQQFSESAAIIPERLEQEEVFESMQGVVEQSEEIIEGYGNETNKEEANK
jgi:hypothetical protein